MGTHRHARAEKDRTLTVLRVPLVLPKGIGDTLVLWPEVALLLEEDLQAIYGSLWV